MLAYLVDKPFDRDGWIFEIKWDGYRAVSEIEDNNVNIYSRNDVLLNQKFMPIVRSLKKMELGNASLDGEIVVLDSEGRSDFSGLQQYIRTGRGMLVYYVFDLIYYNGFDLRGSELSFRKDILNNIFKTAPSNNIRVSGHIENRGIDFYKAALDNRLEGIIAKDKKSLYESGKRSRQWLKIKARPLQEAVVCGYTLKEEGPNEIKSLITGVFKNGKLVFSGLVGGGLDQQEKAYLLKELSGITTATPPFEPVPKIRADLKWVKPVIVIQVEFTEWTNTGLMRQPVYKGIRIDISPQEAVFEKENNTDSIIFKNKGDKIAPSVKLSNPDKVFWPEDGIRKGDMFDFYKKISPYLLPYITGRLQSLNRCPDGIYGQCFYHKDMDQKLSGDIKTVNIYSESRKKHINYLVCTGIDSLLYMVNLGTIEINPWLSRVDSLDYPDYGILDLDPVEISFGEVRKVALMAKEVMDSARIKAFCKTSGSKGIHLYIPLGAAYTYEQALYFLRIIAKVINDKSPQNTSLIRQPAKRRGKVYLDCYQNKKGATVAAPYCLRPKKGAPVSTPLLWEELSEDIEPVDFNMRNIFKRLDALGDIWKGLLGPGIDMAKCLERIQGI